MILLFCLIITLWNFTGVIKQDALITALKTGQIRAAGLDVMTPEPLPPDHELTKLPNCSKNLEILFLYLFLSFYFYPFVCKMCHIYSNCYSNWCILCYAWNVSEFCNTSFSYLTFNLQHWFLTLGVPRQRQGKGWPPWLLLI